MSYIVACDLEPSDPGAPGEGLVHVLLVESGADDGQACGCGHPRHHNQEGPAGLGGLRMLGGSRPCSGTPGANAVC